MNDIEKLIADNDFKNAEILIKEKLDNNDNDIELLKNLGLCQVNLKKTEDAIKTFSRVVELSPDDATSHFYLGLMYKEIPAKKNKAISELQKVIKLRENYFEAYKILTIIYLNDNLPIKAQEIISKAYAISSTDNKDFNIPYLYANTEIMLKNIEHAIELFEEVLMINSTHIQTLNTLGSLYLSKNELEKSYIYYEKSLSIDNNNPATHFNIGSWYVVKTNFEKACEHFEIAYELSPIQPHLAQLAFIKFRLQKYKEAEDLYQKLCTQNPQSLLYRYNYAVCMYETKKYTQAISLLLPIVQQNPKSATMAHRLALCFEKLGQIKNASLIYEKIIKLGKVPHDIYLDYAKLLVLDSDYPRAENILKKLIKIDAKLAIPHKDLGVIYLMQRLFDEAKDEFEQAISLEPNNPMIIFEYANYYQAISEFSEAEKYYEKAYKFLPDNENILLMCGLNKMKLKNDAKAKEFLTKVLKINPQSYSALYNMAQIAYSDKQFELAKEYLVDAYTIKSDIEITNLLALTYIELQDYHNAKVLLNKLNNEYHNNPAILTTLAKAEMLDNNPDMAKSYLEQVIAIFPESIEAQELLSGLL